ncbi:peptide methionine sulfoxide reductase MsrB [Kordiimonas sediminis]|uniref:Peptide methionine sulfoxide reductase MsrB n=1 Tax=Kordiimonas sediminis TaxID=1735581 RepID=A0A919AS35_9PROT|nr:peptide-methionine (R)-S-oxide reductase MsrB [Kordiimonas sediminis]GHF23649.1 peptide methionine sulfoxide reductase MsrB [Kordiimonas sediminis]
MTDKIEKTDQEWREQMTAAEYDVCRCGGTEPPFSGKYWDTKTPGTYLCAGCRAPLFDSETKYDSGSGWPSFWQAINDTAVTEKSDTSYGMVRTEIKCAKCDSHLGHVFPDGPQPTGLRYCVNSASLHLEVSGTD